MSTPFDDFLLELSQESFRNPIKFEATLGIIMQLLKQLRTTYLLMREVDLYNEIIPIQKRTGPISLKEVLDSSFITEKAYLHYFLFLTVLNQSYRVIEKHLPGKEAGFPDYKRIKFYRDKVIEHWERYTERSGGTGLTFEEGKIAIPIVEEIIQPTSRKEIQDQIVNEFKNIGCTIDLAKYHLFNLISSKVDYSDVIYSSLEKVDINFHKSHEKYKSIIDLLFKFGFPAPICDVQKYLETFVEYARSLLLTLDSSVSV
jgi:hypothetical protein